VMANSHSSSDDRLDAIVAEYYEARDAGRPLTADELATRHPELASQIRQFIGDIENVAAVLQQRPGHSVLDETLAPSGEPTALLSTGSRVRYIGDYEILEQIGSGGMGVVYKARQAKLKKIVALKMIKMGQLASEQEVRRFQAEARAAANLDHPGIVAVHEVGVHHQHHYYAMDYVAGDSLSKLHRDEPVAARRAAELVQQMAEAMHYAHSQGIVHRDLKPANVLLTTNGTPRITDFGLAKRLWSDDEESAGVTMTETGQVLGTAGYMSPEQAAGKTRLVGPPADIYALGAILYALLTSRAPFVGESYADTVLQVIHNEPISPRVLNPSIARNLETICLKCLEKEPHKRYGTAAGLADDLGRWLAGRPIVARPVGPAERSWLWCKRRPALVSMSLLLVVLTLGGTLLAWERQKATRASAMVEALLVAAPQSVPYVVDNLASVRRHSLPILRERLTEASRDPSQRLHAAVALASFGEIDVPFLVSSIPQAEAAEFPNIVGALRADSAAAIACLKSQFAIATEPNDRFRLALVALQFGEVEPSRQLLALAPDPTSRTLFIHHFKEWRGNFADDNLADYAQLIRVTDDPDFQSGMCLVLGQIPAAELNSDERQALEPVLKHLYANSPYASTHSAAGWAVGQWKMDVPLHNVSEQHSQERDWYVVKDLDLTLLKVPAGSFQRGGDSVFGLPDSDAAPAKKTTIELSQDFWLGDREVTRKQYELCLSDANYPFEDKPQKAEPSEEEKEAANPDWYRSPDRPLDRPATASWFDAILFCNWLSCREGLEPYYERTGEKVPLYDNSAKTTDVWRRIPTANGYRLPTEAEWEHACRAQSSTNYCFGDDETLLIHYAVTFPSEKKLPVGQRLPNGWGLFDMHGNIMEWVYDYDGILETSYSTPLVDPSGPHTGTVKVQRGGSIHEAPDAARSSYRDVGPPWLSVDCGFRVARNCP
jgi:formylglycine-generating enzyme required for sulfatase activity/tRNA A-37 threonylcarbamoyl transferase component Bud32